MKGKILLTLLALGLWLANTLVCFCCDFGHSQTFGPELTACAEFPSNSSPDSASEDCGFCCGHQVFTSEVAKKISVHSAREQLILESMVLSIQFNFRSIYHPPKA